MSKDQSKHNSDPGKLMDEVEKRFKGLSPEKKAETLVDAGILTKNNKARAPYKEMLASL